LRAPSCGGKRLDNGVDPVRAERRGIGADNEGYASRSGSNGLEGEAGAVDEDEPTRGGNGDRGRALLDDDPDRMRPAPGDGDVSDAGDRLHPIRYAGCVEPG
jgi:hypothetical protein